MGDRYFCKKADRRAQTAATALNGIDWIEVVDRELPLDSLLRQKTLLVHFLKPPPALPPERLVIEGGARVPAVKVVWAHPANAIPGGLVGAPEPDYAALPDAAKILVVRTADSGDFSTYTLRIAGASPNAPDKLDPQLARIEFSFKVECLGEFDCKPRRDCPPQALPDPDIDYLAKDYATFRRLMLDRLSVVMPEWRERNAADLGVALVELLAYAGDRISYFQDAVATEAYLGTARRRTSVRRHARLLDYAMHDGCNARTWVRLKIGPGDEGLVVVPFGKATKPQEKALRFLTAPDTAGRPMVFEAMHPVTLRQAHNEIKFHTWSDTECCLPKGATRATLADPGGLALGPGDVLLLEEIGDPRSGESTSADPAHRQAVRLKRAVKGTDPVTNTTIVEIEWHAADALRFPLCVSGTIEEKTAAGTVRKFRDDLSVAHGNVVLVDHGESGAAARKLGRPSDEARPRLGLREANLTRSARFDQRAALEEPAAQALSQDPRAALPVITLFGDQLVWEPRRDLLASDRFAAEFVVEAESDGSAAIRFGDDQLGRRPSSNSDFTATMRLGNGAVGNVGRNAIVAVQPAVALLADGVTNPLPASGGVDPEPIARVKLDAPEAFRTQQRAVTAEDYARAAEKIEEVTHAAARFRWTGSWHTVFVTIDRANDRPVDEAFRRKVRQGLERVRLAGYDLQIEAPVMAPLEVVLVVCVKPGYFRANVKRDLLEALSNRDLPGSRQGFFHPDRFTFGSTLYLSQLYAAALAIDGVASVEARAFKRRDRAQGSEIADGFLRAAPLEILRLANDPNYPEHGRLELDMRGGS